MILLSYLVVVLIGAIVGSFTTAILHRVGCGTSWVFADEGKKAARSECPQCAHKLQALDLIPLFSWLFLKGRCRYCEGAISVRYPLIEFVSILLSLIIFRIGGVSFLTLYFLAVLPFILAQLFSFYQNRFISKQLCFIVFAMSMIYFILGRNYT